MNEDEATIAAVVDLPSGGTIQLLASFDLFTASEEDFEFVLTLIRRLRLRTAAEPG